jgi:hypothetical protein
MIIVYLCDESTDRVAIVTVRDARTAGAATSGKDEGSRSSTLSSSWPLPLLIV